MCINVSLILEGLLSFTCALPLSQFHLRAILKCQPIAPSNQFGSLSVSNW